jgi:hypothetical protein
LLHSNTGLAVLLPNNPDSPPGKTLLLAIPAWPLTTPPQPLAPNQVLNSKHLNSHRPLSTHSRLFDTEKRVSHIPGF